MKNNSNNNQNSKTITFNSIRINSENKKLSDKHLLNINNKKFGRKVKFDDLLSELLLKIDEQLINDLQNKSLSNEDKKEQLRQLYIKKVANVSKDEFTGFMLTPEFSKFVIENQHAIAV